MKTYAKLKGEHCWLPQPAQRSAPDFPKTLSTPYTPRRSAIAPSNEDVTWPQSCRAPWHNRITPTWTTWPLGYPPKFSVMPTTCEAMQLSLNVLVFNVCLPKGKEEKSEKWVGGGHHPFKSPGSHFNWMGKDLQQWRVVQQKLQPTSLSAPLWLKEAIGGQSTDVWRTGSFLPTLAPVSCV